MLKLYSFLKTNIYPSVYMYVLFLNCILKNYEMEINHSNSLAFSLLSDYFQLIFSLVSAQFSFSLLLAYFQLSLHFQLWCSGEWYGMQFCRMIPVVCLTPPFLSLTYFCLVYIKQLIPWISSLTPLTTLIPLMAVLCVSAVKDINDDFVSWHHRRAWFVADDIEMCFVWNSACWNSWFFIFSPHMHALKLIFM